MAEQYSGIIHKRKVHPNPIPIDPDELVCDIYNRKGQNVNVPYVHGGICKGIKRDRICMEKCSEPGVALLRSDSARWEEVMAHNIKMEQMTPDCMPPIIREKANKSTLADTHFNTGLRIFKHGMVSRITGEEYNAHKSDDGNLKQLCKSGKRFWLLTDETTKDECFIISQWKNSDQEKNLGTCNESLSGDF